ncbi:MAG: hypothetical protein R3E79_59650 [Caldilineaceae bacterium]
MNMLAGAVFLEDHHACQCATADEINYEGAKQGIFGRADFSFVI